MEEKKMEASTTSHHEGEGDGGIHNITACKKRTWRHLQQHNIKKEQMEAFNTAQHEYIL
jgi:hypothetical protein